MTSAAWVYFPTTLPAQLVLDGVDIKNGRATNGGCVTATGAGTTIEVKNANFEYCKAS